MSICSTAGPKPGDKAQAENPVRLISIQTAARDLDSHPKTLKRMAERDPQFPKIIPINNRDFLDFYEWEDSAG